MSIFSNETLNPDQSNRIEKVRAYFTMTLNALDEMVPYGKERGLMVERLEEACMWAVKGISREKTEVDEEVNK